MKNILIVTVILGLAGYAVYLNIEMKNTVNQYESSAIEMANRFEKVNEEALKAREELAKQVVLTEEAKSMAEAAKTAAEKAADERQAAIAAAVEKPAEPVKIEEKEAAVNDAKAMADKAKAAAEALLKQSAAESKNLWEEREAHL